MNTESNAKLLQIIVLTIKKCPLYIPEDEKDP